MRRIWTALSMLFRFFVDREIRRTEVARQTKIRVKEAIKRAESKTKIPDRKRTADRVKKAAKKARDLGLLLVLTLALCQSAAAQSAEERIANLPHGELKAYTAELVQLSREQAEIIKELETRNADLESRLVSIQTDLAAVSTAVNNLGTRNRSIFLRAIDWVLKIAPVAVAVVK